MKTNKKNTAVTAAFIVAATLAAKICGMLRDILVASLYGTSTNEAVAFSTATRIPLLFFDIALGSAVTSAFIPIFNEYLENDGRKRAIEFSNSFINLVALITIVMTAVGMIFSGQFVRLIAGGYDEAKILLASQLVKILFPTIIFTGVAYCFVGILQSFGEFYIPAVISLVSNGLLLLYLVFVKDKLGVYGVAAAMLVAWSAQVIVQIPPLVKMKYSYKMRLNFKDGGIKKVCVLALPIIVSTWVQPINTMVNIRLASGMAGGGAVTALDYANKLYIILVGVFTFAITNLIFPSLSRAVAKKDNVEFASLMKNALRYVLFIITPVMAGFLLLSMPVIRLFYERGAFGAESTNLTAAALFFYSLGMLGYGVQEICNKAFYAMHDGRTPMAVSMGGIAVNIALSVFFVLALGKGHWALALAASVAANIIGITMLFILNKKVKGILNKQMLVYFVKILISVLIMSASVLFINNRLGDNASKVIAVMLPACAGAAVYFVCCAVLGINEISGIVKSVCARRKNG